MKIRYSLSVLLLMLATLSSTPELRSQAEQPASNAGNSGAQTSQGNSGAKDAYPLAYYDERLKVERISFFRRHAGNGRGEFLDVVIELQNRSFDPAKFAITVLAVNETTAVDEDARKLVPYPAWREYDFEKARKVVNFFKMAPNALAVDEVWDQQKMAEVKGEIDAKINRGLQAKMPNPTLNEMIRYLTQHPEKAMEFTLYGETGPDEKNVMLSNYVPPTEDEVKRQVHDTLDKHTYTIVNAKYRTTVTTHHYVQYRPGYVTFNKVAVMIFNPEKPARKLVYRAFLDIDHINLTN